METLFRSGKYLPGQKYLQVTLGDGDGYLVLEPLDFLYGYLQTLLTAFKTVQL